MGRVITARDLELINKLFKRWGFVLVADIAGFLIRILHGLGYDVEYFPRN